MGTIFISHSSVDNELAENIVTRLKQAGHTSVFLDFHPEDGIPAGRNWEQELYRRLRMCRAVIVLCTEHSMASKWCFAEIAHARALGKPVIPIKADECEIDELLKDRQILDLAVNAEEAFGRLLQALEERGLDPEGSFTWNPKHPPYPGLLAFQESEAATFFGRDDAIRDGLAAMNRLRDFVGANLLLVHGSSGAGKSSLVRAGLVPRLRRNPEQWLVLDPFRPLGNPLAELAGILQTFFAKRPNDENGRDVYAELRNITNSSPKERGNALAQLARDLRHAAQTPEARVVLVLDQAEELLSRSEQMMESQDEFLAIFRALCECDAFVVIVTLRSDFLGMFQSHPHLSGLEFEALPLGPLSAGNLRQVITGPAALAGLDLESDLVETLCSEAGSADALPLLAFTLRELWERRSSSGQVQLSYRDSIGGLAGAIARRAEETITSAGLSTVQEDALRTSFLQMVRLNEEGEYARRGLSWENASEEARPVLERFVRARLLVSRGDKEQSYFEVAHEAIFHAWGRLAQWLADGVDKLRSRTRLESAASRWIAEGQHVDFLLPAGRPLEEARSLIEASDFPLDEDCRSFALQSIRLRESQAASLQAKDVKRRQRASQLVSAVVLLVVVSALATYAFQQKGLAEIAKAEAVGAKERTEITRMAYEAMALEAVSPIGSQDALLLALEGAVRARAAGRPVPAASRKALMESVRENTRWQRLDGHLDEITSLSYSPNGRWLLTSSADHTARLWDGYLGKEKAVFQGHTDRINHAEFSPNGERVLTASSDQTVRLWDVSAGKQLRLFVGCSDAVNHATFSADGSKVAAISSDGSALVWDANSGAILSALQGDWDYAEKIAFNAEGNTVLIGAAFGSGFSAWDVPSGDYLFEVEGYGGHMEEGSCFSPDGSLAVVVTEDAAVQLWSTSTAELLFTLEGHEELLVGFSFSQDSTMLLTLGNGEKSRVWSTSTGELLDTISSALPDQARVEDLTSFSCGGFWPSNEYVVLFDSDEQVFHYCRIGEGGAVWRSMTPLSPMDSWMETFFVSPDGSSFATLSLDSKSVLLRRSQGTGIPFERSPPPNIQEGSEYLEFVFSPNGELGLAVSGFQLTLYEIESGRILWNQSVAEDKEIQEASFSPDSSQLLTRSEDGGVSLFSAVSGNELQSLTELPGSILTACFAPDGESIAVGTGLGNNWIWDIDSGDVLPFGGEQPGRIMDCAYSPDGTRLISGSSEGSLQVRDVKSGEVLTSIAGHHNAIVEVLFSSRGELIASIEVDGEARIWNELTGARFYLGERSNDAIRAVAFSPDGQLILTGTSHSSVALWNAETGELKREFRARKGVWGVRFSADGTFCVADFENESQYWEVESGIEFSKGPLDAWLPQVAFSPLSNQVVFYGAFVMGVGRIDLRIDSIIDRAWAQLQNPERLSQPTHTWLQENARPPEFWVGSRFSESPLHVVAQTGNFLAATSLLQTTVFLWERDSEGRQALHIAAMHGSLEVAKLLLEHGAEWSALDFSGESPLDLARENGHQELVALLLAAKSKAK